MFAVAGYNQPDEIFSVGPLRHAKRREAPSPALYAGPREGSPSLPLSHQTIPIAQDDSTPRLFVTTSASDQVLTFDYKQSSGGTFAFNKYDSRNNAWLDGIFHSSPHGDGVWSTGVVPLFDLQPFHVLDVGIYSTKSPLFLRSIHVETLHEPLFENDDEYSLATSQTTIAAKSTTARLFLPRTTHPEALTVLYRTSGNEVVTFNRFDPTTGHWTYGVFSFTARRSSSWQKATIPIGDLPDALTQFGIYAPTYGIALKDAKVSTLNAPVVEGGTPVGVQQSNAASGTSLQVAVPSTSTTPAKSVTLAITSREPGTINLAGDIDTSGAPGIEIPLNFSAPGTREISVPLTPIPGGIETFSLTSTQAFSVSANSDVGPSSTLTDDSNGLNSRGADGPAVFQQGRVDSRIFVISTLNQRIVLSFEYRTGAKSTLAFNQETGTRWSDVSTLPSTLGIWKQASIELTATQSYTELGVFTPDAVAQVRNLRVSFTR